MAGKLTIRRVGNLIPQLCLAGVLILAGIFLWLSTAGIPGCALHYIEEQAAAAGVPVKLDHIQMQPHSGLAIKAEGIRLAVQQQDAPPAELNIRKVKLVFSLGRLLSGDYTPTQLQIRGGELELPLGEKTQDSLKLESISLQTGFGPDWKSLNATLEAQLHGVELEWKAGLRDNQSIWNLLPAKQEERATTPDISAWIGTKRLQTL